MTFSSGSSDIIAGDFDLVYTDTSGTVYTATVAGFNQGADLSHNVDAIQAALDDLYAQGVGDLQGVNVVAVDSLNYQIF